MLEALYCHLFKNRSLFQNFGLIGIAYKLFCVSLFSDAFLDSNLKFSRTFLQGGNRGKVRNWSLLPYKLIHKLGILNRVM